MLDRELKRYGNDQIDDDNRINDIRLSSELMLIARQHERRHGKRRS